MYEDFAKNSCAVSRDVFGPDFCRELAFECQSLYSNGFFKKASIGSGNNKKTEAEIRGDLIYWVDEKNESLLQKDFLGVLMEIRKDLNRKFYLGLRSAEAHYSVYPPEARYDKHYDNQKGRQNRIVTFVLYLNEDWQKNHGGELQMFSPTNEDEVIDNIEPHLGQFVLFDSKIFPHQVLPNKRQRKSLTGWLRDDGHE